MAVGDIYELTLTGKLQGQDVVNVFHYEGTVAYVSTNPTPSHDVAQLFTNQVMPKLRKVVSRDVTYTDIGVRNLFNASDAADTLISLSGLLGTVSDANTLPPFNSITFGLKGDNPAVRAGSKRLPGVVETYSEDGIVSADPTFVGDLNALGTQFTAYLYSEPLLLSPLYVPVVVKRVRGGISGSYTYRMPATPAEKVVSRILVAAFDLLVTSQLSRKFGKGD